MSEVVERESGNGNTSPDLEALYAKRKDPFLVVCRCFSIITAISAILCVVVNVLSAVYSFKNGEDVFDGILRCYAVVIALFVAIAETEWERIFKFWRILDYWVGRGMLQVFVAVMTKALSRNSSQRRVMVIMHQVASYMLLSCGAVYIVAGLLCIAHLKRRRLRKEQSRGQVAKDLEDVERRRRELQGLLAEHS